MNPPGAPPAATFCSGAALTRAWSLVALPGGRTPGRAAARAAPAQERQRALPGDQLARHPWRGARTLSPSTRHRKPSAPPDPRDLAYRGAPAAQPAERGLLGP